jgi:hypothetical protein
MKNRSIRRVGLAVIVASLAACSNAAPPADAGGAAVDVPEAADVGFDAGFDAGFDTGATDVVDVTDVVDAVDASDVDNCADGGVLVDDGGVCLRCAAGERVCGGRCSGPDDPTTGCGRAGCEACAIPNATAMCTAGACARASCLAGFAECDLDPSNGCEVTTRADRDNCGACGNHCALPNATPGCVDGVCAVGACAAGFGDCDAMAANGCETSVLTALAHCGGCGMACAPANAVGRCAAGACGVDHCNPGFADCDGLASNGCEVDTGTDATHCGSCANRCSLANSTGACVAGACTVGACAPSFANCDGDLANGCEVDLRTTPAHCGTCAIRCAYANAAAVCHDGACAFGTCNAGFDNCDGDAANGCEVETASNPASCGVCGRVCDRANATAVCSNGACRIGRCDPGAANCDGSDANGCEVDTNLSVAHCGACGRACSLPQATPVCESGVCAVAACSPSYANCNGAPADGCEVDTRSNVLNCGGCGNDCQIPRATAACVGGACRIAACTTGYGNCDGDLGNGCETTLASDPNNCGACGVFCSEVCRVGGCETCNPTNAGAQCRGGTICRCTGNLCTCES